MYRKAHFGATNYWPFHNAGARHWPVNRFRLHSWLYRSKITVIMKRLMEWLT